MFFTSRIFLLSSDHELNIGFGCKASQAIIVMKNEMYKDCDDRMNAQDSRKKEMNIFLHIPLYVFSENKNKTELKKNTTLVPARERKYNNNIGRRVYKSYLKVSDPFHQ